MRGRIRTLAGLACIALVVAVGVMTAAVASAADNRPMSAAADEPLSRNKPVTASSSGGCCPAKNAVDGKATTRWASAAGKDPQWIYVDLGVTAQVSRVRLQWDKSCATAYRVQTSADHATWTAPTVLIWGTTNPIRDALSAIQFQPPNGGHWDYRPGHNNGGGSEFKTFPHDKMDIHNWSQCELVGN
jgi:hypothetical protein